MSTPELVESHPADALSDSGEVSLVSDSQESQVCADGVFARYANSLVVASAPWVSVHGVMTKMLDELQEMGVSVIRLDESSDSGACDELEVVALPSFFYFADDGVRRHIGALGRSELWALCGLDFEAKRAKRHA